MNSCPISKSLQAVCGLCVFTILAGLEARGATNTWDGGGANNFWTSATNWVGDVAPVAGDDLLFPPGAMRQGNSNNFPAGTTFNSIIFSGGAYSLSGNSIALNAGILATNGMGNTLNNSVVLNSNQTFTISVGSGSFFLPGAGAIDTNAKDLTLAVTSFSLAQVQAVISGTGGLIKTGTGSALFYASNTFSGPVQLNQGFMNIFHGNALGATNGSTTISSGATLFVLNAITVPEPLVLSGILRSGGSGAKTWTGPITLAAGGASVGADFSTPLTVNAVIAGSNGFSKTFSGALTLNSNNTYTGTTTINDGTLGVNGSQPASPIALILGTLTGTGTVGTVTASGASAKTLAPGGSPGILTCSNVTLSSSTSFAVELNGTTPGSGYDQLNVNGTVALSNATLSVTSSNLALAGGEQFIIINNDGGDSINGTFTGLPEGASVSAGTNQLHITYAGGDGNDVVLARISPAITLTSITPLGNGHMQLQATGGVSGFAYTIEAASNLNPVIQWSNLGTALANGSGQFSFTDTNAPLFPMRFYRALSP